jgi:HAD superfamily hydrolase (TIGR01509 family)
MIKAVIFDFDGLILETEGPIYQSWQEIFEGHGLQLSFDYWSTIVGTTDVEMEPIELLEKDLGRALDREALEVGRWQREHELILGRPILPGVLDYLESARRLELKIGLASSSPCEWVEGHLSRLGLIDYFESIKASDDVERTKPDPALYLAVLFELGVAPREAVALEDSPNGVTAAKRAGMYCVAVPNELTGRLPINGADLRLESLADLPLEVLIEKIEQIRV